MTTEGGRRGWEASLAVRLDGHGERTRVVERSHRGPLLIQRPFYPEAGGICHLYIVHPPGGVVGGDRLDLRVSISDAGQALLTTPAATKLYRSAGSTATIEQRFDVQPGASLEWLPQETIAFDGSRSRSLTAADVAEGGSFIGWEMLCLGRPASDLAFEAGNLVQRLEIKRGSAPLLSERLALSGGGIELSAAWGLQGWTTVGTLVAVSADGDASPFVESVVAALAEVPGPAAVTIVSGVLVCRVLTSGARQAQASLSRAWSALRPALLARDVVAPRIWAT